MTSSRFCSFNGCGDLAVVRYKALEGRRVATCVLSDGFRSGPLEGAVCAHCLTKGLVDDVGSAVALYPLVDFGLEAEQEAICQRIAALVFEKLRPKPRDLEVEREMAELVGIDDDDLDGLTDSDLDFIIGSERKSEARR